MESPKPYEATELSTRRSDALEVALYWVRDTIRTYVMVEDHKTGDQFVIDVPEDVSPNDVFEHPFRYRDSRPID